MIRKIVGKVLGTRNEKLRKKYQKRVQNINALESTYQKMSDDELKSAFEDLKKRVKKWRKFRFCA